MALSMISEAIHQALPLTIQLLVFFLFLAPIAETAWFQVELVEKCDTEEYYEKREAGILRSDA